MQFFLQNIFVPMILNTAAVSFIAYLLLRVLLFAWVWFVHDLPIQKIRQRLFAIPAEINESNRGRGIVYSEQERQIEIAQRPLKKQLEQMKYDRKVFYERMHLLSLFK